jgi:hypothetical protein
MALTTNQGLDIPDGTDNANVPLSFTNYNTGVENRLVERYLSIADRTARNAAPFEGELSYLADLNRYEYYTGTAWANLIPATAIAVDNPAFFVTSLVYTTAGAPVTGASVVVPASGIVRVDWTGLLNHSTAAQQTFIAPQLNAGSVVGAGAVITAAGDATSARMTGAGPWTGSSFVYYTGLTAGTSVNAFLMHRVTAITGSVADRRISIAQVA